jgi:putative membrane protein
MLHAIRCSGRPRKNAAERNDKVPSMPSPIQAALDSWEFPVPLTLAIGLTALGYLRGWLHLRATPLNVLPAWRTSSFYLGLFLIWVAVASPIAAFDEKWLTVHMIQHLLLMTLAPPLIWLGAPVMPLLHGLPRKFVQAVIGPLLRWPPIQRFGSALGQPAFCWFAAVVPLVGWHVPAAFTLALQSEGWHMVEHASFLVTGLLFWWPVVQPWPSVPAWPRWSILLYLFLATLPCDVLSGFLVFSERVAYPVYLSTSRQSDLAVLEDQQCAGALMWTCVTVVYLVAGTTLATRLLSPWNSREGELATSERSGSALEQRDPKSVEVG